MLKLKNMEEFSDEVEKLVKDKKMTYIEAVIEHLSIMGIDVDSARVKNLVSPKIQQKMYEEAVDYNMFRGKKKLNIFED